MEINYFFEEIKEFNTGIKTTDWISQTIINEGKTVGEINIIFCNDEYLLKINQEHLTHDYYTDIITFDYSENTLISGDLFISKDRVEENAEEYKVSFENELNRVIIHGILHLIGYNDKSESEIKEMRTKENYYLDKLI
jgi:rRNA maturation RNase YbeY